MEKSKENEGVIEYDAKCNGLYKTWLQCLSDSECVRNHPDQSRALYECSQPDSQGVLKICRTFQTSFATCRRDTV